MHLCRTIAYNSHHMKQSRRIPLITVLLFTILLTVSCTTAVSTTPTPFIQRATPTPNIGGANPLQLPIAEVLSNPVAYEGARIQIRGRFKKLPLRVCEGELYRSPASYSLTDGTQILFADGFEDQIRQLLPEQIEMEVSGIWRKWSGPVGCGKEAVRSEAYYLDVRNVISPNPITAVTLTPSGEEIADVVPTNTAVPDVAVPPEEDEEDGAIESTPDIEILPSPTANVAPTSTTTVPRASATPTSSGNDVGDEEGEEESADSTATPTNTAVSSNATATATPIPTRSGGIPTSTPTSAAEPTLAPNTTVVDKGTLSDGVLGFDTLIDNTAHSWSISVEVEEIVTISAAMQPDQNAVLSLISPSGEALIDKQNLSGAGDPEVISAVEATTGGIYTIEIRSASAQAANYVLNYYLADTTFTFNFQAVLSDSDTFSGVTLPEETDHIWTFFASAGETVSFSVIPDANDTDFLVTLYSKDGDEAESDEFELGATESILDFSIPETGMYALQIGDWDLRERGYTLEFERN